MASLRKRWKERREAYEHCEAEIERSNKQKIVNSQQADSTGSQKRGDSDAQVSEQNDKYSTLQQSLLDEATQPNTDNYSSLLLPSFVQKSGNVKVFVEGTNDSVITTATKISAEYDIAQLTSERDAALEEARSYRDQVDNLRSKNRKLYCEMHDRVEVIRNFWRNNIEGSTRGGLCVQTALRK